MKPAFFRFHQVNNKFLLTNECGDFIFLNKEEFENFLRGKIKKNSPLCRQLSKKNFIKENLNLKKAAKDFLKLNQNILVPGPSLFIIVLTLRCNHRCIYCQVSPKKETDKIFDLNEVLSKKIVDFIFSTPNKNILLEFQGGEPLLNWEVLKFVVLYAKSKNMTEKRNLSLSLVSNLTLLDDKKLNFLIKENVSICTSLDGPEKVHNFNRRYIKGNSYLAVVKGIKKIKSKVKKPDYVNAIATVTRASLGFPKEIVREYLKLKLNTLFVRPFSPFGLAKEVLDKIDFSAQDYVDFYKKMLDYLLEINAKGKKVKEHLTTILLKKILKKEDPFYTDLCSPCGAVRGQIAFHYNGDIYPCDEARMLAEMGDENFKLGNVNTINYPELINSPVFKAMMIASCLDCLPECTFCAFKPYCGTCPVYNYAQFGNLFAQIPNDKRCKIMKGIFEVLFERLENPKIVKIFQSWV